MPGKAYLRQLLFKVDRKIFMRPPVHVPQYTCLVFPTKSFKLGDSIYVSEFDNGTVFLSKSGYAPRMNGFDVTSTYTTTVLQDNRPEFMCEGM